MAIATPADKRFRRAHVKPLRKRVGRGFKWRFLRGAVLVAAVAYAVARLVVLVNGMSLLEVNQISVRGNQRLSVEGVQASLDGLIGRNILTVNLGAWRLRLLKSSWVEEASIRRILPSTIDVTVTERHPLGICRIGGRLYLVDAHGVVIDEYGPAYADIDLPIIRGLVGVGASDGFAVDIPRAALAARALSSLSRQDVAERISEVDVTDLSNVAVMLKGDTAVIRLGREDFLERLQSYFELASVLRERIPDIDYVDLRFDRRVYVRPIETRTPLASRVLSPDVGPAP